MLLPKPPEPAPFPDLHYGANNLSIRSGECFDRLSSRCHNRAGNGTGPASRGAQLAHERAGAGPEERKCFPMAAPQSFVPQRPSRSKSVRRFTLAEANSTLPLVKRIVADIVKSHGK